MQYNIYADGLLQKSLLPNKGTSALLLAPVRRDTCGTSQAQGWEPKCSHGT